MVGVMNSVGQDLPFYLGRGLMDDGMFQPEISAQISDRPFTNAFGEGERPIARLYAALEQFAGRRAFDNRAVQIKVTLDLDGTYEVWRRLVVPIRISFKRLHDVIQSVFGWLGYHLYDFYIFDDTDQPVLKLVDGQGAFEYPDDIERVLDNRVLLNEIIPTYTKIKYDYDFGDNWQHYIEVERIIGDYDKNYAECIDGVGNTPPEDVGGISGYQQFREIIADPQHEEYESTLRWAESLNYRDFDIERVRRRYC